MEIVKDKQGSKLKLTVVGRVDTTTAPSLETAVNEEVGGVSELEFDFAGVEYVSSAGLRVLLNAQKTMNKQGSMTVAHVSPDVKDVFDMTGFSDILTLVD